MYFQLQIHIIQTTTFSATLKKSILAVGLLASTCNLLLHHLPPGCKVPVQQSVGGAEASIVNTDIYSAQLRVGFYPGEQRSNV